MKKLFFLVTMLIFISGLKAQSLNRFFQKYDDDKRFESVSVGKFLFNLALLSNDIKGEERELLANLQRIRILTTKDNVQPEFTSRVMRDLQKVIRRGDFENLVEVRDKGERVNIYTRMRDDYYTDLLIEVNEASEINLIWINGKLSRNFIEKLQNNNNTAFSNLPIKIKL